jgi:hypothetical protein
MSWRTCAWRTTGVTRAVGRGWSRVSAMSRRARAELSFVSTQSNVHPLWATHLPPANSPERNFGRPVSVDESRETRGGDTLSVPSGLFVTNNDDGTARVRSAHLDDTLRCSCAAPPHVASGDPSPPRRWPRRTATPRPSDDAVTAVLAGRPSFARGVRLSRYRHDFHAISFPNQRRFSSGSVVEWVSTERIGPNGVREAR